MTFLPSSATPSASIREKGEVFHLQRGRWMSVYTILSFAFYPVERSRYGSASVDVGHQTRQQLSVEMAVMGALRADSRRDNCCSVLSQTTRSAGSPRVLCISRCWLTTLEGAVSMLIGQAVSQHKHNHPNLAKGTPMGQWLRWAPLPHLPQPHLRLV
jgi:hypothetical protein